MNTKKRYGCEKIDCRRLQRNFSYALFGGLDKPFEDFKRGLKASVEHHFNNHEFCNIQWCSALQKQARGEEVEEFRYRDKERYGEFYEKASAVLEEFTTDAKLREMYSRCSSQKCEQFNGAVAQVAPKDRTYCGTLSLVGRVHLAVILNSLGYEDGVDRIFRRLGFEMDSNLHTYLNVLDIRRSYRQGYVSSQVRKKRRKEGDIERMRTELEREMEDERNGYYYGNSRTVLVNGEEVTRRTRRPGRCGDCGVIGYRRGSGKCMAVAEGRAARNRKRASGKRKCEWR